MSTRFEQALSQIPEPQRHVFEALFCSDSFSGAITSVQFDELLQKTKMEKSELKVALLPFAAAYSYAPISEFFVGAIVQGNSGDLYFGANMEILGAQLAQTVHAEQSAISHAWMKGESGLTDITINYSPCGHCRQFMNELSTAQTLTVQLPQRDAMSLQEYLPESFGPSDLGIQSGLMTPVDHGYQLEDVDSLVKAAVDALNRSHAPYTKNLSGVAIEVADGRVFKGAYAENAAFNPSLPPLQVAIVQLLIAGLSLTDIRAAALVELSSGKISHLPETQSTLETINPEITVEYASI
ncbi:cytidine deaminase [Vibrio astriarenae]|uniref:Cytidine deaminase n=1 Tax=Vibrio astriarenae TaxID=1481923 RepID=A0A7Z2YDG9_9VIBR|nr:cytidine deaminase [Vibrio astriarenae]QIA63391.1 cytidine deaminase [Vibrio astriarenae]